MDTASRPSLSATRTPASTIRARLRAGFGPLCGRPRTPQAAATVAGTSASIAPGPAIPAPSANSIDIIVVLRIAYADKRTTYAIRS